LTARSIKKEKPFSRGCIGLILLPVAELASRG